MSLIHSGRTVRCLLAIALTALAAVAQDDKQADPRKELREAEAGVSYAREADGRITVSPNPATGGFGAGFDFADLWLYGGMATQGGGTAWWSLLLAGGTDLSATVDARHYFELFGEAKPESLLDRLRDMAKDPSSQAGMSAFEGLLVAHALADLQFKPALGWLERIAANPHVDGLLKQAATDAIGQLRGTLQPPTTPPAQLGDLAAIVALAPADHDALLVVDRWRLPPGRDLLARLRRGEVAHFEEVMLAAGGGFRPEHCAGANSMADRDGLVAYELARCFGNQRIDRLVLALHLQPSLGIADGSWLCCEGAFDLARIESGARAWHQSPFAVPGKTELKVSSTDHELRIEVGSSAAVQATASRILISVPGGVSTPIGLEHARKLLARMPDAPLRGSLCKLPGTQPMPRAEFGFWPPWPQDEKATIDITLADGLDPKTCLNAFRIWLLYACRGAFRDLAHTDYLQPAERGFHIGIPADKLDFAAIRAHASGW